MSRFARPLTPWLERAPRAAFVAYAMLTAFAVYFCMYAFRKPFAAARFEGLTFFDTEIALKTTFVISQILGYTLSKYVGIKVLSEMGHGRRARVLVVLILAAEAALFAFGALPGSWKVVGIFLNGVPLGMVWGIVVSYLEGRRTSEILLAGLSCSFIVASGVVKDVGVALMDNLAVSEAWMPAATGALFLPAFLVAVWLLNQLPEPDAGDMAERVEREPMDGGSRLWFIRRFLPGLLALLVVYFFLTAYRDFRDNYGIEIFQQLGYEGSPAIFTRTELPVAFGVMLVLAALNLIRDNRRGLLAALLIMLMGAALLGVGTSLLDAGAIDGATWMVLIGLGSYLCYVPYGSVLFDRLIAHTRVHGTAVFTIYLADALGYTGSIAVQLYKDLGESGMSRLGFMKAYSYLLAIGGVALIAFAALYFARQQPAEVQGRAPDGIAPETGAG